MGGLVAKRQLPVYPEQALQAGLAGDVIFKVLVDETGKIVQSEIVDGNPLLAAASVDALREFRFRPYLLNGSPLSVESQMQFRFSLDGKGNKTKGHVEYEPNVAYRPEFRTGFVNDKGVLTLYPRKIAGPDPQLPPELAERSGSVYLTVLIGADGKVQDVIVIGGDEAFIAPVVSAVKQFVYEPRTVGGKPSATMTQQSFHFGKPK
jgi:TonB family protein